MSDPAMHLADRMRARALDPTTPGAHLSRVRSDDPLAPYVARNPATPFQRLLDLVHKHPRDVLANPAFRVALAVDPGRLTTLLEPSRFHHKHIAAAGLFPLPECPATLIEAGLANLTPALARALLRHPNLTPAQLEALENGVRAKRAGTVRIRDVRQHRNHPKRPPTVTRDLLDAVARGLAPELLESSRNNRQPDPALLPPALRDALEGVAPLWLAQAARDPHYLHHLHQLEPQRLAFPLAQNPDCGAVTLTALARDEHAEVRRAVAAHPNTPPDALAVLAGDSDGHTALRALRHPNTPPETLRDALLGPRSRALVAASNPSTPVEALRAYAATEMAQDLAHRLLSNPSTPVDLLLAALHEDASSTHAAELLAAHPHAPYDKLHHLALHADVQVRVHLADNPALPEDILLLLATDLQTEVRSAVAQRAPAPEAFFRSMLDDPAGEVRAAVRQRLGLAPAPDRFSEPEHPALKDLQEYSVVRRALYAARSDAQPEVLTGLIDDPDPTVLVMLALNPSTPVRVLETLTTASLGSIADLATATLAQLSPAPLISHQEALFAAPAAVEGTA